MSVQTPPPRGWFHTAALSGEVFANTQPDDLLIRTSAPTQRLLLGPACAGSVSAVQVGADSVTLNTSTVMHGRLFIGIGNGNATPGYTGGGGGAGAAVFADASVTTLKISPGAITTTCIASGAVTSSRLGRGAVDASSLAPLCVGTASLADAGVTTAKLGLGSVTLAALSAPLAAPRFDLWVLAPPSPSVVRSPAALSAFLYAESGRDPTSNANLTLSASSAGSARLLDPSSGMITFPTAGVYELTSSLVVRSSCNDIASALTPPATWLKPLQWYGSNIASPVRLGYAAATMTAGAEDGEYSGVMRTSFTGVFRGGDVVALTVSAGGWTTGAPQPSGIWFDTSCNASYLSVTLLRPLLF